MAKNIFFFLRPTILVLERNIAQAQKQPISASSTLKGLLRVVKFVNIHTRVCSFQYLDGNNNG